MKNVKKNGGFTLVELIVVIAILAILAAVAIPAYSGYIEKAEKANDLQLLGAVNQAFGAACVENNIFDMTTVEGTVISLDSNGYIVGMNVKESLSNAPTIDTTGNPVLASFIRYYGDNINTPFKYFHTKLTYTKDGFEGMEPGEKDTGLYGQVINELLSTGKISQETINAIKNSEFGEIGAEELLNKVNMVTGLSNTLAMGDSTNPGGNANYKIFLEGNADPLMLAISGYTMEQLGAMSEEEFMKASADMNDKYQKLIADKAAKDGTDVDTAKYSLLTNYAVLSAAANTNTGKTAAQLGAELENGDLTADMLKSLMKQNDQGALGEAAMMYGMYTAWVNTLPEGEEKTAAESNAASLNGFINDMDNESFVAYLKNTEGSAQTDLEGYVAAMQIINSASTNNTDAVNQLLLNGFSDSTLQNALEDLLK